MSCEICLTTKKLPTCLGELTIGTISSTLEDVLVVIKDITTGRIITYDVTSDGAGLVKITIDSAKQEYMPGHSYKIWITKKSSNSIEKKETITIGTETTPCARTSFERIHEEDNTLLELATQVLEVC